MMVPIHKLAAVCVVFLVLFNEGLTAPVDEHASVSKDKKPQQSSSKLEEELKLQNPSKHATQEPVPPKIDLAAQDVLQEDLNEESMRQILDSMSFEDILESVLETLKDHPNILKELTEEEEKNTGITVDDDFINSIPADFQKPPPQLMEVPKRVEKKAGNNYLKEKKKSDKWKMYKQKNSGSSEENIWKQRFDDSSSSESSSSSSSSSSSEEENSMEKRDKEKMEDTIDLVALPMEGGEENKRAKFPKNFFKQYRAWGPQEHYTDNELRLMNNPYINTLPLFMPEDLKDSQQNTSPDSPQQEQPESESEAPVKTLDQIKAIEKNVAEKKEKSKLMANNQEKESNEKDLKALTDEGNAEMSRRSHM